MDKQTFNSGDRAKQKSTGFAGIVQGIESKDGEVTRIQINAEKPEPGQTAARWVNADDAEKLEAGDSLEGDPAAAPL